MARRLRSKTTALAENQSGAVVVIVAILIVVLMGMAAFAVDLGWLYWNGVKIQHGADAAALSGVVYEPGDKDTAYSEAMDAASENGYVDANPGTTVTPQDFSETPTIVHNSNQLAVTVTDTVPTFFMSVFGIDSVAITKMAIAEYVLPLAMGSNLPYFGEDPTISGREPHFWGNIHGYYTGRTMGDRYSSQCLGSYKKKGCEPNPDRRPTIGSGTARTGGYIYGIEVPEGASNLKVEIFDGPFYRGGSDYFLVGDNPQAGQGPTTTFMLYGPDPTPLDTTDGNPLLCTVTYAPQDTYADFDGDGKVGTRNKAEGRWNADPDDDRNGDGFFDWADVEIQLDRLAPYTPAANGANTKFTSFDALWDRMCGSKTFDDAGIYPLRVVVKDPLGADDRGLNRYSLRAWATGGQPRIYGLGDMAIYANFAGSEATFNLAEVAQVHAGKDLVIELWDPDSGNSAVTIEDPDGSVPSCSWNINGDTSSGSNGALVPCHITGYADGTFNNKHMQIRIPIPSAYSCSANCWWTIKMTYGFADRGANDTTTWSAHIEGNPVRLVE